ncbi:membrane protein DedA with SNARE-associated domain [Rhizobium aquaticum]|uniref:Membrane protein DedA with SNARE-associated domain n=1 Tax=Rhizobium aquaticum TaxID=1549636 RepID=A0ABV2J3Q8_9HYPH
MLESLIAQYGLLAVLIGAGIEGETVVFLGGVSAHRHLLPFWGVAAAAALGSFIADQIFFFLGRRASGSAWVRKLTSHPVAAKGKDLLERYPTGFILAFRFIYGMRNISPVIIGLSAVPARKFVMLNALAALVWGLCISAAGYLFSNVIEAVLGRMHLHIHLIIGLVFAVAFGGVLLICSRWRLAKDM